VSSSNEVYAPILSHIVERGLTVCLQQFVLNCFKDACFQQNKLQGIVIRKSKTSSKFLLHWKSLEVGLWIKTNPNSVPQQRSFDKQFREFKFTRKNVLGSHTHESVHHTQTQTHRHTHTHVLYTKRDAGLGALREGKRKAGARNSLRELDL
jgi:sarcosine oxidase delta subunit